MTGTAGAPASPSSITEPGVYQLDEATYHADSVSGGSLSFSGAKRLLPPSCPAIFRHEQLHGRPEKRAFDFGRAAHAQVLGAGAPLVVVDAEDWRSQAAREQRDEAYTSGSVPILAREHAQVKAMAEALRAHPVASALFDPQRGGQPEQSLFRRDEPSGVMLRSRLDWLPAAQASGRLVVPDYKTAVSAEPNTFGRSAAKYGYHLQAAWYSDMVTSLGLADDVQFLFIAQEKTEPYLITVFEFDSEALLVGRQRNREAIDLYARCRATDTWPGYSDAVELIPLPAWATYDLEMAV